MYRQLGIAYLGLLLLIGLVGIGLATTGTVLTHTVQRENEKELLRAGHALQFAISQYYERSPGTQKRYPQNLEDLLLDTRHLSIQRYIRRIPKDPMTKSIQWGLVRAPDGGIMGVYSFSAAQPIKITGFDPQLSLTGGGRQYADWKFVYVPVSTKLERSRNQ